jgi:hypothetical protein
VPAVKPPFPRLNHGHPLAQGLYDGLPFAEGSGPPYALGRNPRQTTLAGAPAWTGTPAGWGLGCASGAAARLALPYGISVGSFTLRLVFFPRSWPANFTALVDSSPRDLSLFVDSSGVIDFAGAGFTAAVNSGHAMTAGSLWDLVYSRDVVAGTGSTYLNGALVGGPGVHTGDNGSATQVDFGDNPSGGGALPDCVYVLWEAWRGRALTAAEVAKLNADTFGLYRRRRLLRAAAGGGAAGTATPAALSLASSPAAPAVTGAALVVAAALAPATLPAAPLAAGQGLALAPAGAGAFAALTPTAFGAGQGLALAPVVGAVAAAPGPTGLGAGLAVPPGAALLAGPAVSAVTGGGLALPAALAARLLALAPTPPLLPSLRVVPLVGRRQTATGLIGRRETTDPLKGGLG